MNAADDKDTCKGREIERRSASARDRVGNGEKIMPGNRKHRVKRSGSNNFRWLARLYALRSPIDNINLVIDFSLRALLVARPLAQRNNYGHLIITGAVIAHAFPE